MALSLLVIHPAVSHTVARACGWLRRGMAYKAAPARPQDLPLAIAMLEALSYQLAAILLYIVFTH